MKREKSIKLGQLPAESEMNYTFKGYLESMLGLCKNKVFMLTVFGATVKLLYTIGMVTFLIKILILKFGIEPSKAGQTLGMIMIPSLIRTYLSVVFLKLFLNRRVIIINNISLFYLFTFLIRS